jgi:putative glutamine amidotransferase
MHMPHDIAMASRRPVIGIPTQNLQSIGGVSADIPPSWVMSQRYILTLTHAGALPWMLPLVPEDTATLRGIYDVLDGVFLPGGADIDPATYSAERHPSCDMSDPPRDAVEMMLVRWAMEDRKPVLGVCRGLQIMNLVSGGTLHQHLAEDRPDGIKHDYFPFGGAYRRDHLAHDVRIVEPGSRLARIVEADTLRVNSMHHQGVQTLGGGLVATAVAPDGLIEALEGRNEEHFFIGIQWHPEALSETDGRSRKLFQAFIAASAGWREERVAAASIG